MDWARWTQKQTKCIPEFFQHLFSLLFTASYGSYNSEHYNLIFCFLSVSLFFPFSLWVALFCKQIIINVWMEQYLLYFFFCFSLLSFPLLFFAFLCLSCRRLNNKWRIKFQAASYRKWDRKGKEKSFFCDLWRFGLYVKRSNARWSRHSVFILTAFFSVSYFVF